MAKAKRVPNMQRKAQAQVTVGDILAELAAVRRENAELRAVIARLHLRLQALEQREHGGMVNGVARL